MDRIDLAAGGKTVALFPGEAPGGPLVVFNGDAGEGARVLEAARALAGEDFAFAAVEGIDWDDELTPWPSAPVFRGRGAFGGHGDGYLRALTGQVLPRVTERLPVPPTYAALAGYSLAGLFALYAFYRTDAFARVASASGSLWYPGFAAFAREHALARLPERAYLSVGDREARTRNAAMRPVEENTRLLAALWRERGANVKFELNPGGHFEEPEARMAQGIAWMLGDG